MSYFSYVFEAKNTVFKGFTVVKDFFSIYYRKTSYIKPGMQLPDGNLRSMKLSEYPGGNSTPAIEGDFYHEIWGLHSSQIQSEGQLVATDKHYHNCFDEIITPEKLETILNGWDSFQKNITWRSEIATRSNSRTLDQDYYLAALYEAKVETDTEIDFVAEKEFPAIIKAYKKFYTANIKVLEQELKNNQEQHQQYIMDQTWTDEMTELGDTAAISAAKAAGFSLLNATLKNSLKHGTNLTKDQINYIGVIANSSLLFALDSMDYMDVSWQSYATAIIIPCMLLLVEQKCCQSTNNNVVLMTQIALLIVNSLKDFSPSGFGILNVGVSMLATMYSSIGVTAAVNGFFGYMTGAGSDETADELAASKRVKTPCLPLGDQATLSQHTKFVSDLL